MTFSVYILRSEKFDKYYIGQTKDLRARIEHHNSSRAKWTKRYQPRVLIHSEDFKTRSEAMKREKELKSLKDIRRHLEQLKN